MHVWAKFSAGNLGWHKAILRKKGKICPDDEAGGKNMKISHNNMEFVDLKHLLLISL